MNNKINLLTFIHIDNFIVKNKINYINGKMEIIIIKKVNELLDNFKNKLENLCFFTYYSNFMEIINKILVSNNIKKCILVNSIDNLINSIDENVLLIGNSNYYNYKKIKKNNFLIINVNKYNLYYEDNDVIFDISDNAMNLFLINKNDILNILEKEKIYEKYCVLKEDKYFLQKKITKI